MLDVLYIYLVNVSVTVFYGQHFRYVFPIDWPVESVGISCRRPFAGLLLGFKASSPSHHCMCGSLNAMQTVCTMQALPVYDLGSLHALAVVATAAPDSSAALAFSFVSAFLFNQLK